MKKNKIEKHSTIYGKIIAIVTIFSIYLLFISIIQQQKVTYKADALSKTVTSAKVVCDNNGTALIDTTLLNKEGEAIVAALSDPQSGLNLDLGTIEDAKSTNGKVKTNLRVLNPGSMEVSVRAKAGGGSTKLALKYDGKDCDDNDNDHDGTDNDKDSDDDNDGTTDDKDTDDDNDGNVDDQDDDDGRQPTRMPSGAVTQPPSTSTTPVVSGGPTQAPVVDGVGLRFNPTQKLANVGDSVEIQVTVETKDNQTVSTDAYVLYDTSKLQMETFVEGDFFPAVTHTNTNGIISVRGIVNEPAAYRMGNGLLATIKFKVLQAGTSTLRFYCDPNASDSSKIIKNDINATNIINCAANNTSTISTTATALIEVPTSTTAPTNIIPSLAISSSNGGDRGKLILMLVILIFIVLVIVMGV